MRRRRVDRCADANFWPYRARQLTAAFEVVNAALAWWEDHGRKDCHFCKPIQCLGGDPFEPPNYRHDDECPVGAYIATLDMTEVTLVR